MFGSILIDDQKAIDTLKKDRETRREYRFKIRVTSLKKGVLVGTAVVAGVTAAAGAMFGLVTKTSETADRIDKLSAKTGLSKQAFPGMGLCPRSERNRNREDADWYENTHGKHGRSRIW